MTADIRVDRIQDRAVFRALQDCWSQLLQDSAAISVFLTWEWLYTWFKHLCGDGNLLILRLSCGEDTVGLVPLALRPHILDKFLGVRAVEFLGVRKAGTDYLDMIIRRGWEEHAVAALERFAADSRLVLRLGQIKKDCFASQWASQLEYRGWRVSRAAASICPFISLRGHSWQSYLASLGREHRYNVQRKLRNLSKTFEVQFEQVTSGPQCQEALSLLIGLHNRRRKGRGGSSAFCTSHLVSFHEEFTRLALARGWLRLFVLRLDGKPAASLYGFRYGGVFYFYQSGFDPAYAKHSVGLVTMALSIKSAIEEGAEEYDLLRGDEDYKFHWTRTVRELGQVVISPPGVGGALHQVASQFSRGSRRLARRVLPKTMADAIAGGLRVLDGLRG
jgi:CelD/BcsL family acetyltransferase involved in cellulose biosynthesis